MNEHHDIGKIVLDVLSGLVALGSLMKFLPEVSALVAIVWYCIRIWESKTVQGWFGREGELDGE